MIINFFPMGRAGGGRGFAFDLEYGPILPTIVVDRRIFVMTTQTVPNWHISTNQPAVSAPGDMWIEVAQGSEIITISDTPPYFSIGIIAAKQYSGVTWTQRDGYLGVAGLWRQFSSALPPISTPLAQYTWSQIDFASRTNVAKARFAVGDLKPILINGVSYNIEIIDFAHDDLADGSGKAGITFCLKDCLGTTHRMNPTNSNAGGWNGSEFRGILQSTIKNQLENDLRVVIKPVLKKASAGNASTTIITTIDDLFLISETEITGAQQGSIAGEGTQYPRFTTAATRIKRVNNVASIWWTRSPYYSDGISFCSVTASGTQSGNSSNELRGIAFAFCV